MASVPVLLYSSRIDYVDDDVDGVVADDDVVLMMWSFSALGADVVDIMMKRCRW